MTRVLVPYAADDEVAQILESPGVRVEADMIGPGIAELVAYAGVFPLVPQDQVTVDDGGVVTGIHRLAPVWVFEVFCRTPEALVSSLDDPTKLEVAVRTLDDDAWEAAKLGADQVITELARMALIHRAGYAVIVATESRVWFDAWRKDHPHVWFVQQVRTPDSTITFDQMQHTLYDDREVI